MTRRPGGLLSSLVRDRVIRVGLVEGLMMCMSNGPRRLTVTVEEAEGRNRGVGKTEVEARKSKES